MRFAFIDAWRHQWRVATLCRVMRANGIKPFRARRTRLQRAVITVWVLQPTSWTVILLPLRPTGRGRDIKRTQIYAK